MAYAPLVIYLVGDPQPKQRVSPRQTAMTLNQLPSKTNGADSPPKRISNVGGIVTYTTAPQIPPAAPPQAPDKPAFPASLESSEWIPDTFSPEMVRKELEIPSLLLLRLDNLTHDSEASKRLVQQVADRNPHQNGKWCAEKAIADLERDRR